MPKKLGRHRCGILLQSLYIPQPNSLKPFFPWDFRKSHFFAGKVGKVAGWGGKVKNQTCCPKSLPLEFKISVDGVYAIFAVSQKRMAYMGQMSADLMGFAGFQLNLEK